MKVIDDEKLFYSLIYISALFIHCCRLAVPKLSGIILHDDPLYHAFSKQGPLQGLICAMTTILLRETTIDSVICL